MAIFKLDAEETRKVNAWYAAHCSTKHPAKRYPRRKRRGEGGGGGPAFEIIPDSVLSQTSAVCRECGEKFDFTDYDTI